ncbi:Peptidase M1 membrane alanine aminopeptidase [Leadbetterella byssophila DSM 17132]|uniref:Peptidase M1 membrane alanine aminopeptidase n=1 Tax=Leadbetterella byssophila (strain DSM 17132 / JCM 16389 / KACC 11308 / NBRC 106382 / 4M15) TaxID=649349 RepID=E4RX64_LEAB4|nr:M1 family metallopeptidase [Leadbetterella byssophila]ADQ18979.1 Peptidase M1 membrane alanine aminopeptidase [Leadbetterella byssophila DSM 17132]
MPKSTLVRFFALLFLTVNSFAQVANYDIEVSLEPKSKKLKGTQILHWTNTTSHPASELQFHLYLNAFKDLESSFMKESGGRLRNDKLDPTNSENFGHINILKISGKGIGKGKFIQPDNFNEKDHTVISYPLGQPVLPGQSLKIELEFEAKLPKIFARTGWSEGNYFFVGQWFPKIGVLEENGEWNCHQFHANTEFYADFGTYNVKINAPKEFLIGATGELIDEKALKNERKLWIFRAQNVHDFAWTASPNYIAVKEEYKGISLTALMQKENKYQANRYLESVKKAIDFMEERVGKYPHSTLTMVDPSYTGSGSGGMEYPTLITCGTVWGLGKWMKFPELVTIHEFVHQYFQGILASNEFENSWMDEGFTQYFEARILEAAYPPGAIVSLFGFHVTDAEISRTSYVSMPNPAIAPIRMDAWKYPKGTYSVFSYTKPATVLRTMERWLGTDVMDKILKTYFEEFKFKHPRPEDFFNTAIKVSGKPELEDFFKQTILEAKVCDYYVKDISTVKGKSIVELDNKYDMLLPVQVKVQFKDGSSKSFTWDGVPRKFEFKKEVVSVNIDLERVNQLDLNLLNNSLSVEAPKNVIARYAGLFMFWVQSLFAVV